MTVENFVTWEILATYAGATTMTAIITQFIKDKGFLAKLHTPFVSYIIAVAILLIASAFTSGLTVESALLVVFNAVLVSIAANGGFDRVNDLLSTEKEPDDSDA